MKTLNFSSPETESKYFFPFSKEEARNEESFVEHSHSRVCMNINSQSITSLSWQKRVFECVLPSGKSPHLTCFRTFLWDIDYRLLGNSFQRCRSKPAKTCLWVRCALVEKSAFDRFPHICLRHDYRLLRNSFQRCSSKPAKTCFWVRCALVEKSAFEALSTISRDIDYRLMRNSFQRCSSKPAKTCFQCFVPSWKITLARIFGLILKHIT